MEINHNEISLLNEKNTGKKIDKFLAQWFGLLNKNNSLKFLMFFLVIYISSVDFI